MIAYVDASVLIAEVVPVGARWQDWAAASRFCSSSIVVVEARRTLHRLALERHLDDEGMARAMSSLQAILRPIDLIDMSPDVLERASGAFATNVKTLDAIHLSTALLYRIGREEPVSFVTADRQQATAARAHGLDVLEVR